MRRIWRHCGISAITFGLALGCSSKRKAPKPGAALASLSAPSWLVPLSVTGFAESRVAVPLGAQSARPLLIAIHGAHDRPEWQCGSYRGITHGRSFILCPAGVPQAEVFTLGSPEDSARELRAAVAALKAKFGKHLARGSVVLAALGPGVDHALALALEEPSFFSHLVLVNGSFARLTPAFATRFGQLGGKRVLAVCGPGACEADTDLRVQSLRPGGVESRLVRVERGQGLDADVASVIEKQWSWLIASDSRWR
ncbi:MAG: hypothetical protein ACOY0T_29475 [Myxococcota bacterium]